MIVGYLEVKYSSILEFLIQTFNILELEFHIPISNHRTGYATLKCKLEKEIVK